MEDVREIGFENDSEYKITISNMLDSEFGIIFCLCSDGCRLVSIYFLVLLTEYIKGIEFRSFSIKRYLKKKKYNWNHCNEYTGDIQEDPIGSEYCIEGKNLSKFDKYRRRIGANEEDDNDEKKKKVKKIFLS